MLRKGLGPIGGTAARGGYGVYGGQGRRRRPMPVFDYGWWAGVDCARSGSGFRTIVVFSGAVSLEVRGYPAALALRLSHGREGAETILDPPNPLTSIWKRKFTKRAHFQGVHADAHCGFLEAGEAVTFRDYAGEFPFGLLEYGEENHGSKMKSSV